MCATPKQDNGKQYTTLLHLHILYYYTIIICTRSLVLHIILHEASNHYTISSNLLSNATTLVVGKKTATMTKIPDSLLLLAIGAIPELCPAAAA